MMKLKRSYYLMVLRCMTISTLFMAVLILCYTAIYNISYLVQESDGEGIPAQNPAYKITVSAKEAERVSLLTDNNVYLLARLISAEVPDDNWLEMIKVGAEVMRRVRDSGYPNSIAGIIFEQGAFQSVTNGTFWKDIKATDSAVRAARDVLRGIMD